MHLTSRRWMLTVKANAGIGVWRAAFKPFVDRIADNDIRLQWF